MGRLRAIGWACATVALAFPTALTAMEVPGGGKFPEAQISKAEDVSNEAGGRALIVMQGGRMLHESYANGGSAGEAEWMLSITKSIAAAATLALASDGVVDLDEPVAKTIDEWDDDAQKRKITIRELLNQTSGLASGYSAVYGKGKFSKNARAIKQRVEAEPGSVFEYGPAGFEVLEEVFKRRLAGRGTRPVDYIRSRIFAPLGIGAHEWRMDSEGNAYFSTGAKLTARDLVKFGEFVRTNGRVGLIPILPQSTFGGVGEGSAANPRYGLGLWLNSGAAMRGASEISVEGTLGEYRSADEWTHSCLSRQAPDDLIAMIGSGGMRCYIVPSMKLVVVRFGTGNRFSDAQFLRALFSK